MTGTTFELLDFVVRWIHVIAGIMWIGNSLLFNWLDRNLVAPTGGDGEQAPLGTIWLLHSGGFYYVEKTMLRGRSLPVPLHWFKWQAYTTWLTGVALLLVVYYLSDRAVLTDPSVANVSHASGALIGFGSIVLVWGLYEFLQRVVGPRSSTIAAAIWLVGFVAVSIALTRVLSGRAAFLHVGAMLGTIMAGNVFLTIVPSQRELVASVGSRSGASSAVSARAKRVSLYNNYFTFPVIALMVSNHFPSIYGHRWSWVLLLLIIASGATVRHILNVRYTFEAWKPALALTMVATVFVIFGLLTIPARSESPSQTIPNPLTNQTVSFDDARHVIDRRCAACHSARPSDLSFGAAPAGVMFDTPEQIVARAARIRERAVVTRTMPPGNKTHITDDERAILARWIALGALAR
jgi:uncharacterized membrane protein